MAEDATAPDPAIASSGSPIVDQPRGLAANDLTSSEGVRDSPELDTRPLLFIRDGTGNKIPLLWEKTQKFSHFKSYVEEIYTRKEDKSWVEKIRKDEFHVAIEMANEMRVVLPSLWNDFVHPGMTVLIMFMFDENKVPLKRTGSVHKQEENFPTRPEVEIMDVDVDVSRMSGDISSIGAESSDLERSVHNDGETTEDVDSVLSGDDEVSEAPSAKPIRAVIQPVDQEGNPLSFSIDTRWAAKFFLSSKVEHRSRDSLTTSLRNGRDMAAETLKITKVVTNTAENRTTLEVYTLPGPENNVLSSSVGIRWHHLHGEALDWGQFKTTCLTIPGISERVRYLIVKTLNKIEKEYIKAFLGGLFVEPGTVVRGDECHQPEPQSVIFSCTPYFDIQKCHHNNPDTDRLHPPRTLIQSYYPYEPVRDRDEDQAYRSIGNSRDGSLIHVPVLWMLNVGNRAVVTCGYGPLSSDLTKSIKVLQEDIKQLDTGTRLSTSSIRFTVPDGRVLLYSLRECGTYFQVEQRLKELWRFTRDPWSTKNPQLLLQQQGHRAKATPANWPAIVRQRLAIFVDIAIVDDVLEENLSSTLASSLLVAAPMYDSVPPFYHWPAALSKDEQGIGCTDMDAKHATKCLEKVEDAMLNEVLTAFAESPVQRTFTSTKYYESLLEDTFENVESTLSSQIQKTSSTFRRSQYTHHQILVHDMSSTLPNKAHNFVKVVHDTLGLFVGDVNKPVLMRKVWGATANIAETVKKLTTYRGYAPELEEYTDPDWKTPKTKTRAWRIRTPVLSYTYANKHATKFHLPLPQDEQELGSTLTRCRRCAHETLYNDPNAALEHLQKHAAFEAKRQNTSASSSFVRDNESLKNWIRNDDQALLESTVAGACAILDRAIEEARKIYEQLKELADGVRNEQGTLSDLYTFPRKLLETLHRLVVFYFAVERSLHYTEEYFKETKKGGFPEDYPYTDPGLEVLSSFRGSTELSLLQAREELCEMVRSSTPNDAAERISWGAESISSWLIRRLVVKPLEKSMTVGDMYREYLSTLQFQVNHRPGKRLLRSINLLQEELTILARVNDWQTQLVINYMSVLNDATYPVDIPSRRALYSYERILLNSCLDNLTLTREEYEDQIRRCGPLSNSTKQSAEINEEDHGKAILVFTVVTVIFLPLSFVTSYLGMNTSDIRDMDNKQSLFWEIALPLTMGIMATMLAIAYNGDEIRDFTSSIYRFVTGKQDRRLSARGISVLQRERAAKNPADSPTTLSMADDAEYVGPKIRPDHDTWYSNAWDRSKKTTQDPVVINNAVYREEAEILIPACQTRYSTRRSTFQQHEEPFERREAIPFTYTEPITLAEPVTMPVEAPPPPRPTYTRVSKKAAMQHSNLSRYDNPLPPREQPTYVLVNSKHILPSVLDDAYLPWDYDNNDPSYMVIKQHLQPWETEMLFTKSRKLMEGRVRQSDAPRGSRLAGGEYVWKSKKDSRRRARPRRTWTWRFDDGEP